jgi:hypothetical protein
MNDIEDEINTKDLAIKNNKLLEEFFNNRLAEVKDKAISKELKAFWEEFDKKLRSARSRKQGSLLLRSYVKLSPTRAMLVYDFDNMEPWFVKIKGFDCETGAKAQEILNSRNSQPELIIDLFNPDE